MYHSITFSGGNNLLVGGENEESNNEKNTWDDWFLIPSSRPVFNPPKPKTKYVDLPGADGHLDLTTALTGDVAYDVRTGSIEFIVDNDHAEWYDIYSDVMDYLHGQEMRAILEDEPSYFYEGRFSVNKWKSDKHNSKITIDYTVAPYKYELATSIDDWLWDPFNFNESIIREYKDLKVDKKLEFAIPGIRMKVTPIFHVKSEDGSGLDLLYEGEQYRLPDGTSRVLKVRTHDGINTFVFTGKGTVSIEYRGGRL